MVKSYYTEQNIQKITDHMFLKSDPNMAVITIIFGTRHKEPVDVFVDLYNKKIVPQVFNNWRY